MEIKRRYCAVCLGKGVVDFRLLVQVASAPGTSIGFVVSDGLTVATFISTFTKEELYDQFDGLPDISVILTHVDNYTINMETPEMEDKLLTPFDGFDETQGMNITSPFGFTPISYIDYVQNDPNFELVFMGGPDIDDDIYDVLTDEDVAVMSEQARKEMIDDILLRGDLTDADKKNIDKLSK